MKKVKIIFLALISISILNLTACKKDDAADDNPTISGGSMSLKVDGTAWSASLASQAVNTNGVINVTGSDSDAHQVAITLLNVTEPGTYSVGGMGNQNGIRWTEGLASTDSYLANFALGSGSITITELTSSKIVGTFSGSVANTSQTTKKITEGTFNVSF